MMEEKKISIHVNLHSFEDICAFKSPIETFLRYYPEAQIVFRFYNINRNFEEGIKEMYQQLQFSIGEFRYGQSERCFDIYENGKVVRTLYQTYSIVYWLNQQPNVILRDDWQWLGLNQFTKFGARDLFHNPFRIQRMFDNERQENGLPLVHLEHEKWQKHDIIIPKWSDCCSRREHLDFFCVAFENSMRKEHTHNYHRIGIFVALCFMYLYIVFSLQIYYNS